MPVNVPAMTKQKEAEAPKRGKHKNANKHWHYGGSKLFGLGWYRDSHAFNPGA